MNGLIDRGMRLGGGGGGADMQREEWMDGGIDAQMNELVQWLLDWLIE